MKRLFLGILLLALLTGGWSLSGCSRPAQNSSGKLQVVTTLFPLYDFARTIGGEQADVTMLLPPGMEPHSFEPKPNDIVRIGAAGLFIYTNPAMEPWAAGVLKGIDRARLKVVDAGQKVNFAALGDSDKHDHEGHGDGHGHAGALDPHIWLDFTNAGLMVDAILAGFNAADPVNATRYQERANRLKMELSALDSRYRESLAVCDTRVLLHGGHFTFGYLARRYGLTYRSLSGVSSESEPSAARMAAMVKQIRSSGTRYLFAEELLSTRLSETLAAETGVSVLMLHGAHNIGRDDAERAVGFIGLMDRNLANLKKGLSCRPK